MIGDMFKRDCLNCMYVTTFLPLNSNEVKSRKKVQEKSTAGPPEVG